MFQFRLTAQEGRLSANPRLFRHGQDQRPTRLRFRRQGSGVRQRRDFDPQRRQNRANCWRLIPGLTLNKSWLPDRSSGNIRLRQMFTSSLKVNPSNTVFLLRDPDTQPVCRFCDFSKSSALRAVVADSIAGNVVNRGMRYLVIATIRPDTRNAWFPNVPVPVDGAGGSPIG